jgi:hypothetical protein
MSFFAAMKKIPSHLPHGTEKRSFTGFLIDKGERYGAAAAYGAAKGYYGERFLWKGHGLDLWTGAALTLGSAVLNAMSNGNSKIADHAERIGDAGMMSAIGSLAASWGMNKAGRSVAVLAPGKNAKGLPAGKQAVVGEIPAAVGGAYLTADEIARFAQRR